MQFSAITEKEMTIFPEIQNPKNEVLTCKITIRESKKFKFHEANCLNQTSCWGTCNYKRTIYGLKMGQTYDIQLNVDKFYGYSFIFTQKTSNF